MFLIALFFWVVCGWRWSGVRWSEKTQHKFSLGCRLSGQKGLQSLLIHFEFLIVFRMYNNHNTV